LFSKELEHISTRVSCIGSVAFSCGIIGQGIANMIDGIISTRLATENDASRRLKSEFLIQFDGLSSNQDELVIVIEQSILLTIQIKEQCAFTICCHKTEAEPCHILEY